MFGCLFFLILLFISAPSLSSLSSSHLSISPLWNSPVHSHHLTISQVDRRRIRFTLTISPSLKLTNAVPAEALPTAVPAADRLRPRRPSCPSLSNRLRPHRPSQSTSGQWIFSSFFFFFDELVSFFIWVFVVLA